MSNIEKIYPRGISFSSLSFCSVMQRRLDKINGKLFSQYNNRLLCCICMQFFSDSFSHYFHSFHFHSEKQERLEKIREKLSAQMQQKLDDEDVRIQRAQEEREAKREAEERGKEQWIRTQYREMADHRHQQVRGEG